MPRSVKPRTRRTYQRDIETLGRLKIAIVMDTALNEALQEQAIQQIDSLTKTLVTLFKDCPA